MRLRSSGGGRVWKDATGKTEVRSCSCSPSCFGLFAKSNISSDSVVAKMRNPIPLSFPPPLLSLLLSLPSGDTIVTIRGSAWTESGFRFEGSRATKAPKWYRMNHTSPSSSTCRLVASPSPFHWVSTRDLRKGDAITWSYGKGDPSWKKDFCSSPLARVPSRKKI